MLMVIVSVGCLLLAQTTRGVSAQTVILDQVNKSLTESACQYAGTFLPGERIVLTASLDTSNTSSVDWPLTNIILASWGSEQETKCRINIEADGCHGYQAGLCGYCSRHENATYHLVFNLTAVVNERRLLLIWVGSISNRTSGYVYFSVEGDPYLTTQQSYGGSYLAQDIATDTLAPNYQNIEVLTSFSNTAVNHSWAFKSQPGDNTTDHYNNIRYNVTEWEAHIDDQINIQYQDACHRNWNLAVPVTDLPQLDCDLPVITRSNSTGSQVALSCNFSTYQPPSSVYCDMYPWVWRSGQVTQTSDRFTCVVKDIDVLWRMKRWSRLNLNVVFQLDVQFTNGTAQTPRVVRFQVDGSKSVTVDPGALVTLKCKVYGNPEATAVIAGPGGDRRKEHRAYTDLLELTFTQVQCQDSGRYSCLGVSSFGTTPSQLRAYVDVNVNCPTEIQSYIPSNQDRIFLLDPEKDVLITFQVYGYPAPAHFYLQTLQDWSWLNVSRDLYKCTYASLDPSRGLLSLLLSRDHATNNQTYSFSMSNGNHSNQEFQFQLRADYDSVPSTSPWMSAFIAVTCILGVCSLLVVIVVVVVCMRQKSRDMQAATNPEVRSQPEANLGDRQHPQAGELKHQHYDQPVSGSTDDNYHQPGLSIPRRAVQYENTVTEDDIYENAGLDNVYELSDQA